MIVVLADDFSGAAELANSAVGAGLSAEVQLDTFTPSDVDVICVDADTRSLSPDLAAKRFAQLGSELPAAASARVFKKCDSVLRGHIAAESRSLAAALGRKRVLLAAANPSRGRVIHRGEYFIAGMPLVKTAFAADPDHPRCSSHVRELLGDTTGIETPDIPDAAAIVSLARSVDAAMLPVGAVDFFEALLASWSPERRSVAPPRTELAGPTLFVCGSHAAWLGGRREVCEGRGIPIFPMPEDLLETHPSEALLEPWVARTADALHRGGRAMLAIGAIAPPAGVGPTALIELLTTAAAQLLSCVPCARVLLEGGATASALLRRLDVRRFRSLPSPGAGVGSLEAQGSNRPIFLTKPGSYEWPPSVWLM